MNPRKLAERFVPVFIFFQCFAPGILPAQEPEPLGVFSQPLVPVVKAASETPEQPALSPAPEPLAAFAGGSPLAAAAAVVPDSAGAVSAPAAGETAVSTLELAAGLQAPSWPAVTAIPDDCKITKSGSNTNAAKNYLPGYGTIVSSDEHGFIYRYDLGASKTSVLEISIEAGQTPIDLSNGLHFQILRLGSSDYGLRQVQVLIEDTNHETTSYYVDVSDMSLFSSPNHLDIQKANVAKITFRQTAGDLRLAPDGSGRRGELFVHIDRELASSLVRGKEYDPQVYAPLTPSINASTQGSNSGSGTVPGFVSSPSRDGKTNSFRYDIGGSSGAVVTASFRAVDSLVSLPPVISVAAKNSGNGARVRVEIVSEGGKKAWFVLDTTDAWQTFDLDILLAGKPEEGFDPAKVTAIHFIVDRSLSPQRRGSFDIQLPSVFSPVPVLEAAASPVVDAALFSRGLFRASRAGSFASIVSAGQEELTYNYDVRKSVSVTGHANVTLDVTVAEPPVMSAPPSLNLYLSAAPIGYPVQYPVPVRIHLFDEYGAEIAVDALVGPELRQYTFDFAALNPGFQPARIRKITFEHGTVYSDAAPRAQIRVLYSRSGAAGLDSEGSVVHGSGRDVTVSMQSGAVRTWQIPVPPGADPNDYSISALRVVLDEYADVRLANGQYRLVNLRLGNVIATPHAVPDSLLDYHGAPIDEPGFKAHYLKTIETPDTVFLVRYIKDAQGATFLSLTDVMTAQTRQYAIPGLLPQFEDQTANPAFTKMIVPTMDRVYVAGLRPFTAQPLSVASPRPGFIPQISWLDDTVVRLDYGAGFVFAYRLNTNTLALEPEI